ncbi:hypothetical protein DRQ33_06775 [bacterium]|nr:MAG: hypothetical protein DRQ33_06775 [bacterium]
MLTSDDFHSEAGRFTSDDGDCRHGCSYGNQYFIANGNYGFILLDWSMPASPVSIDEYTISSGYAVDANIQYPYIYAVTRTELLVLSSAELSDTSGPDITGPTVVLIEPEDSSFSSCLSQALIFSVRDDRSGVDWSTVRLTVNGIEYTGDDLYHSGDTIYFAPMIEYPDGQVINYSFTEVYDSVGNPAVGLPISGIFTIDYSQPSVNIISPADGDTVYTSSPSIRFSILDSISGIDSCAVRFNLDSSPVEHSELVWTETAIGYELTYNASSLSDDFHTFCVTNLADRAEYCGANTTPITCWTFLISTGVDTFPPDITIIMPLEHTYTSCDDQLIMFEITDPSGVDTESIALRVNDYSYSLGSYPDGELIFYNDTLVFYPNTDYFADGETVSVYLESCADELGNYASPVWFDFYTDFTTPTVGSNSPADGDTVTMATPAIQITINETGSGVDGDALRFAINDSIVVPSVTNIPSGAVATYIPEIPFAHGETVIITAQNIQDNPDYCAPNSAEDYYWSFYVDLTGICEYKLPKKSTITISPNPFNSSADIELQLLEIERGELIIVDNNGHRVSTLFSGAADNISLQWKPQNIPSGKYSIIWTGKSKIDKEIILIK